MAATLNLSILEIVLLLFGAIILGITIHFFIASRRNLRATTEEMEKSSFARDEWKLRYFNDMEARDKELSQLKAALQESEENSRIYNMELDEVRKESRLIKVELENARRASREQPGSDELVADLEKEIQRLQLELQVSRSSQNRLSEQETQVSSLESKIRGLELELKEALVAQSKIQEQQVLIDELRQELRRIRVELEDERNRQPEPVAVQEKPDYLEQLRQAQNSLAEHNQKINELLGNIDIIKEKEEKEREMLRSNEELFSQLEAMRNKLGEKEKEIQHVRQQQELTQEMSKMLDNAYNEFNTLQTKIQKLESQLTAAKMVNLEVEDLREDQIRMQRDLDEQRTRAARLLTENQQLQNLLSETENKLREANTQRMQLQKRVSYLEELNADLHIVSEANKKLENQLRRVSELESMLNVVSEERDQLMRKQSGQA
ncbi:MAG: hypothetical protein ACK4E0_10755 [Chitinophagaceae bacterium]